MEHRIFKHDEVEYLAGNAGSLILACEKCGEEHFRGGEYFNHPEWETCFTCRTPMAPIKIDELETKWKPFWLSLGLTVNF